MTARPLWWTSLALLLSSAALPTGASARTLPTSIELGRDATGQPCVATRGWNSGAKSVYFESEQGYSITCRGVAAARVQGYLEMPSRGVPDAKTASCGGTATLASDRLGSVMARRCFDARLDAGAIDLRLPRSKGASYHGVALETALGPLEMLMRVVARGGAPASRDQRDVASIDIAALAPPPHLTSAAADAAVGTGFTGQAAIARGIALIQSGRHIEAARLLNDAISEFVDASPLVRAELRMTAGLADSNISQFDSARAHFIAAGALLAQAPDSEVKARLETKRAIYMALDATNRRAWGEALAALDVKGSAPFPLADPVVLSQINRASDVHDPSAALNVADASRIEGLILATETNWTRSLSYLGLHDVAKSREALNRAAASVRAIQANRVQSVSIAWLRAGLERQNARIEDYAGHRALALAALDCAVATMKNVAPPPGSKCLFEGVSGRAGIPTASPTVIAEAQLERARIASTTPGIDQQTLLAQYDAAIDTLTAEGNSVGTAPTALSGYLDTLLSVSAKQSSPELDEKFFKAMQATGEPAVAREVVRLQSAVSQDPATQVLTADRGELERQVIRLRYEIQAIPPGDSAALTAKTAEQRQAQNALSAINAKLAPTLAPLDERPVTITELRQALRPGEVYLKLATLNGAVYGAAVGAKQTMIYRIDLPAVQVNALADAVLTSARSFLRDGQLSLHAFAVDKAADLFARIAGPARAMLTGAASIAYDPVGELRNVPAAILVESQEAPAIGVHKARTDYSTVAFLGRKTDLATALSPRSFMVTRAKVLNAAPKPFLGLGQTAYAPVLEGAAAGRLVRLARDCVVDYATWSATYNHNTPISAHEIGVSAGALGIATAPMMTGEDFNNANLARQSANGTLAQYQVLHFATHGLTAQPYPVAGCSAGLPPSLLTTLVAGAPDAPVPASGLLTFDQVAMLRLNANLVFLSACETASGVAETAGRLSGQEDSTPSLDGLVRAFLAAKARTVVATLWSVPATDDTDRLIQTFYGRGRTDSISTALREAQVRLMDQPSTSHPYFWAAYFVVGDGSKQMLTPQTVANGAAQ